MNIDSWTLEEKVRVFQDLTAELSSRNVGMRWRVTCPLVGSLSEDDMLLGEVVRVEELTGVIWPQLKPTASASHLFAIVRARLEVSKDMDEHEAFMAIRKVPYSQAKHWVQLDVIGPDRGEPGDPDPKGGSTGESDRPT